LPLEFSASNGGKKVRYLMIVSLVLSLGVCGSATGNPDNAAKVAELKKIISECRDPLQVPPDIFKQIKLLQGVTPRPDTKALRGVKDAGLVHVFVDSVLYPAVQTGLDQFLLDLQAERYRVSLTRVWNLTPVQIRAVLRSEYAHAGLVGAIFVGDVPAAWMETILNYRSYFPTDYFYMDLNGTWEDYDADGFYDNLSDALEPEIWTGRITPSNCMFGDEARLVNQYFEKNHAYRTGNLGLPDRLLGYMECSWYPRMEGLFHLVYDDVTFVDEADVTTASDYKSRLDEGYEWVHLLAHSSPWGSTFYMHNDTYGGGSVFSYEMPVLNPQANFVVLNACSNAKYTETDNMGQAYLFGSDHVVAVIGETRIMYGSTFAEFYSSPYMAANLGEAFVDWIWWNYDWFWGCNIFGDPTLRPHQQGNPQGLLKFSAERIPKGTVEWATSPVDTSPFTDGNPTACTDQSGNVWAAWNSGRDIRANIWASRLEGSSWSEPEEIAFAVPWDFHPSMCADNSGKVWVFWQSYRNVDDYIDGWDIYAASNGGSSWSDPIRVTSADPYDVEPKSAVDSAGNVWVVWRAERKPNSDIMYRRRSGSGWSPEGYVASSPDEERDPAITVDREGKVWVVWYAGKNGNWDIYAKYYDGAAWSGEIRVTDDPGYDLEPSVATDSTGKVWVVWRSNRNENLDIYAKYRLGETWSPEFRLTQHVGDDIHPDVVCCGGDNIIVAWQSNRDGDWNIYQSVYDGEWSIPSPATMGAGNQIDPVALCSAQGSLFPVFSGDADGSWNIYSNLSFIAGDANGDGIIDLSDPLAILNFLFRSGPAPAPFESADCNCDQMVDLSDALYLLNYLFRGGNPPGC
jgi:hypothetical protein